jgi:hypothetical protein
MGWLILGLAVGFVIGSFFPQPEFFKEYWDKLAAKFNKE